MSSGAIRVVRDSGKAVEEVRVHLMPCSVQEGGGADVEGYFDPTIRSSEEPEGGELGQPAMTCLSVSII